MMNELNDESIPLYYQNTQTPVTHSTTDNALPSYQGDYSIPNNIAPLPLPVSYDCTICLSALNIGNTRQTTCGHSFHKNCIEEWLLHNNTCPVCRHILVDDVSPIIMNDSLEYPFVDDHFIDYLPYRVICGRLRCCYYQIPPPFMLSLQLIGIAFLTIILLNSIISWSGQVFDYFTVIMTSFMLGVIIFLHLLLRNDWRFQNCRFISIHNDI